MINKNEGYIKFISEHSFQEIFIPDPLFEKLTNWRTRLYDLGVIGETPEGIGFGNISIRYKNGFFITGSATGRDRVLKLKGYAFVSGFDFKKNLVLSSGSTKASSESMSHAALYECINDIHAVIHIHHSALWNKYLDKLPTTPHKAAFGTPEMAFEVQKIALIPENYHQGIIIMGGHEDGIITYGIDLDEAGERMIQFLNK